MKKQNIRKLGIKTINDLAFNIRLGLVSGKDHHETNEYVGLLEKLALKLFKKSLAQNKINISTVGR
jgi:hypothetical protein